VTEASVSVHAKSMTEFGVLEGNIVMTATSKNAQQAYNQTLIMHNDVDGADVHVASWTYYADVDKQFKIDEAWLKLGALSAGYRASTFDYAGGFSDQVYRSDTKTDQVRLEWAMGGFGLMLGIEDPRDRWGTSLTNPTFADGADIPGFNSYSMPDIIAAITASQGNWDAKVSAGFAQLGSYYGGSVWGVNAGLTVKLDSIAPGDQFRINGAVGTGTSFVGAPTGGGGVNGATQWSAFASFQHFWSPTLSSALTGAVYDPGTPATSWALGGNLVWAPVAGFEASGQVVYQSIMGASPGAWTGRVRVKRSW
jgi:hypothetical protein